MVQIAGLRIFDTEDHPENFDGNHTGLFRRPLREIARKEQILGGNVNSKNIHAAYPGNMRQ